MFEILIVFLHSHGLITAGVILLLGVLTFFSCIASDRFRRYAVIGFFPYMFVSLVSAVLWFDSSDDLALLSVEDPGAAVDATGIVLPVTEGQAEDALLVDFGGTEPLLIHFVGPPSLSQPLSGEVDLSVQRTPRLGFTVPTLCGDSGCRTISVRPDQPLGICALSSADACRS